jgi:hypothetical protein
MASSKFLLDTGYITPDFLRCFIGICCANCHARTTRPYPCSNYHAYRHARTTRPNPYSNYHAYCHARTTRPYPYSNCRPSTNNEKRGAAHFAGGAQGSSR